MLRRAVFVLFLLLFVFPAAAQDNNTVYITTQRFENGLMIWRSDTGEVDVFVNGGYWYAFPLNQYGGWPDNPFFNTPPGRIRSINGFGRVWGNSDTVRAALGWATASEQGYLTTIGLYAGTPISFMLPDARAVQINGSLWSIS